MIECFMSFNKVEEHLNKQAHPDWLTLKKPAKPEEDELYLRSIEFKNYLEDLKKLLPEIKLHLAKAIELTDGIDAMSQLKNHIKPTIHTGAKPLNPMIERNQ